MYDYNKNVSVEIKLSNFKSQVEEVLSQEKNKSKTHSSSKNLIKRKKTEVVDIKNLKKIAENYKKDF